jgi:hypothetical protein
VIPDIIQRDNVPGYDWSGTHAIDLVKALGRTARNRIWSGILPIVAGFGHKVCVELFVVVDAIRAEELRFGARRYCAEIITLAHPREQERCLQPLVGVVGELDEAAVEHPASNDPHNIGHHQIIGKLPLSHTEQQHGQQGVEPLLNPDREAAGLYAAAEVTLADPHSVDHPHDPEPAGVHIPRILVASDVEGQPQQAVGELHDRITDEEVREGYCRRNAAFLC